MRLAALTILVTALLAAPAHAVTRTITFDDLAAGTTVSAQYAQSHGVTFRGPASGDGWLPVIKSVPSQATSGDRVADISECPGGCPEGASGRTVGRLGTLARTVSVRVGLLGNDPSVTTDVTLRALDANNQAVGTQTTTVAAGTTTANKQLSVTTLSTTADIAAVEVSGPAFYLGIIIDDLAITTPDPAVEPPPPPDFALSVATDPVNLPEGDGVDVPVSINRFNGSNGDIMLSASNLPQGVTATFTPNPVPGTGADATLRLTAAENAPTSVAYSDITITATPSPTAGRTERTATKTMRVVGNCVRTVRADFIDARSERCMRAQGADTVVATGIPVKLNGLLLEPGSDGRLVINTRLRSVSSDGGDVRVSPADHTRIRLYDGEVDWDLSGVLDRPKQVIDNASPLIVSAGGEEPLVDLFLFFRPERVVVSLTRAGGAQVDPTLKFGFWPFNYLGDRTTTATTGFTTDNDHGSSFNGLSFGIDRVTALGLELKDVALGYRAGGTLTGSATAVLRFGKPYEVKVAFGLYRGDFDFLRASVSGLNVPVSAGVYLQRIGFEVVRSPFSLTGSAAFSAGPTIKGVQPVTVNGVFKAVFGDPFVVELTGTANLIEKYFGDRFQLGSAYVRYSSTGLFELGGDQNWDLGVAYANGKLRGFVDGLNAFSLEGSERVCIRVPFISDPCAGADMIASNIGIGACIEAYFRAGVGYTWGGDFDAWWGSCDLSPWRPAIGSRAHAAAARRYVLKPGLRSAAFAVEGEGAAPSVTLTGPRGERISVTNDQPQATAGRLSAVKTETGTTYLLIRRPSAGTWRLEDDGAVEVRRVREAFGVADPAARATVSGTGRKRTLHYRVRPIPGQRVRFVESGRDVWHVIAATAAARGSQRFRPADGPAGTRRIVAMVEQNGLPRARIVAGRYRAPGPPKPAKPARLRVQRTASALVVRWRAREPGFRHVVDVALGDGRTEQRVVAAGKRSARIAGVAPTTVATVTVAGLTHANARGPVARLRSAGAPRRPRPGTWRLSPALGYVAAGRFTVPRGAKALASLRITPGPNAAPACGTAELAVAGRRVLRRATSDGETTWGARAQRVTATQAGKRLSATLTVAFATDRTARGELLLPGCRLLFDATH